VLKRLSAPFRNFFNVRFEALNGEIRQLRRVSEAGADHSELIDAVSQRVSASLDHQHDDLMSVAALLGRTIEETADGVDSLLEMSRLAETRNRSSDAAADELAQHAALDQLDDAHALVANYANAHEGWASQAGLWFNPPISVSHAEGSVTVADINERVAEIPFVYASLGVLPRGARVLDIGSCESTVAIGLASLGYHVTALDPRPYPLRHENLEVAAGPIEQFTTEEPYDAAILLSAIEHFGLGAYDLPVNERADVEAIATVRSLLRPGGLLVLTTPYGDAPTTELERTYLPEQIDTLLEGWDILDRTYLTKINRTEWRQVDEIAELKGDHVILVKAQKPAL